VFDKEQKFDEKESNLRCDGGKTQRKLWSIKNVSLKKSKNYMGKSKI
jgi:hypothetical protein